jgi:UDP-N-acetylmuramoylalanine--D-glutamate ligase
MNKKRNLSTKKPKQNSPKSILICGMARSGRASLDLLYNERDKFFLFDEDETVQRKLADEFFLHLNVFVLRKLEDVVTGHMDKIILSPGFSIFDTKLQIAKSKKIEIVSELEVGYQKLQKRPFFLKNSLIAVTGTNGKTTTTRLIFDFLCHAKRHTTLVGNIGIPLCEKAHANLTTFVCEVSSFQLEAVKYFHPHIACLLNITPDHLDRHKTMRNYVATKKRIFKNMSHHDFAIINQKLKNVQTKAKVFTFGFKKVDFGCYIEKSNIIFANKGKEQKVCSQSDVFLQGMHNLENVLCAVCVAKILKIKNKFIIDALKTFQPEPHRIQKVFEVDGTTFFDDSKGTNVDATLCAAQTLNPNAQTTLILGGADKGGNFDMLFRNLPKNIKKILVSGDTLQKIFSSAKKYGYTSNLFAFDNLKDATLFACQTARSGENVLLSPACSSFDEFKNYEDRGEKFLEYIKSFYESSGQL